MSHSGKVWMVFAPFSLFALWCAYDGWFNADSRITEQLIAFNRTFALLVGSFSGLLAYVAVRLRLGPRRTGIVAVIRFKSPEDGRIEESAVPWLWALLPFGCIYFASKRAWFHALMWLVVAPFGIGSVIYSIFARRVVEESYASRGWTPV